MKKIPTFALAAIAAALLSGTAGGGILNLDASNPVFNPPEDFTNNMLMVSTVEDGTKVDVEGSVTVAPVASSTAEVTVSGTYSAVEGDKFSADYRFAADLNNATPVDFTITGTATILGIPQTFTSTGTLNPGLHVYEGTAEFPIPFSGPASGDFSVTLSLDLSSITAEAAAGTVDLLVQQIDPRTVQVVDEHAEQPIAAVFGVAADVGPDEVVQQAPDAVSAGHSAPPRDLRLSYYRFAPRSV